MKLYWRYKKDGKWTWKPVGEDAVPPVANAKLDKRGWEEEE